jgi:hypothetical protein
MYQMNESLTFTVPLSFEAHSLAEKFHRQQFSPQKAKQVYLNTLAVYAVDFYLRCLGIETEIEKSDSRNPFCLKFMNVADLWVKSIGRLECCSVFPESTVLQIADEVRTDRIGYVAVKFERSLKEATIVGFTPTAVAELPLSQLSTLAEFLEYLNQLQQPTKILVNLSQWLNKQFEASWQEIESLFSPNELTPASFMRGTFVERGKVIRLETQITQQIIVLVIKLAPLSAKEINIIAEVHPKNGEVYLPENLQVRILDEQQTAIMAAMADKANQNFQFDFNAETGERFSVQIILGEASVIEDFVIF